MSGLRWIRSVLFVAPLPLVVHILPLDIDKYKDNFYPPSIYAAKQYYYLFNGGAYLKDGGGDASRRAL